MSNTATTPEAHTALTHTLQHLRHALRCTVRAIPDLGEGTPAALRCTELCVDVTAAARSCANLIDQLDAQLHAAMQRHPAGTALGGAR